jgi:ABC-type cobalt transport system substrate-binding protein
MENKELLIILLIFSVLVFRIYHKYIKQKDEKKGRQTASGSSLDGIKEDDYEPYLKK